MSEFNPADIPAARQSEVPDRFSQRLEEVKTHGDDAERPDREGLPSRYRMRADSHYVEQLLGGESEKEESDVQTTSRRSREPYDDAHVRPPQERQERVLVQIARDLAEVESATELLEGSMSALARRVSLDLIKARTWQASWLLRANAVLEETHRGRARRQPLQPVLSVVEDKLTAECRLAGVRLEVERLAGVAEIEADAEALIAGIAGAVIWTLGLIGDAEGAVIRVTGETDQNGSARIEVVQPDADLPGGGQRAGSPEAWTSELGASVAKAVAKLHDGEAAFLVADGRRSVVRMDLAASAGA